MQRGKLESDWWHTAQLLCMTANANRDPKKSRPYSPEEFHPLHRLQKSRQKILPAKITCLKVFLPLSRR